MWRLVEWLQRHARGVWLVIAVLLGLLQAVDFRYGMNPDGVAYLDMGDAYLRGDWATAIRTHWSPLYAWLLAIAVWLAQPPPSLEFPLVHLVNLAIYCAALAAFGVLLREIVASLHAVEAASPATIGLPDWAWTSLGYALFVWCTTQYMPLSLVTPDLLVSALVYTTAAVALRIRRYPSRGNSALLGGLLGLGYLAKAPMLPLGLVFLAASAVVLNGRARRIWHCGVAASTLALIGVPFIVLLSVANGRLTAGDSAALNYLWMIDGLPMVHWQGGPPSIGQPLHHSQPLLERPPVFALDSPFAVTYAAWYAPEYWFAGARPVFLPGAQLSAIGAALQVYADLALDLSGVLLGMVVLLATRSGRWCLTSRPSLVLLAPALFATGMFALVLVEARYVAPFVVLLLLGLLMLVRLLKAHWRAALAGRVCAAMLAVLVLQIGWSASGLGRSMLSQVRRGALIGADDQANVAGALRIAGVLAGDPVASGNRGFNDYWARLARVRIVAEVSGRDSAALLDADPTARSAAQQVLLSQDVRAVVARSWPARTGDPGWQPIDGTDYFYYLVPR